MNNNLKNIKEKYILKKIQKYQYQNNKQNQQQIQNFNNSKKDDNDVFIIDKIDYVGQLKGNNKIHVLIINLNQLKYTKNLINCLLLQKCDFDLTIFDQHSNEDYTENYYKDLKNLWPKKNCFLNIIKNSVNAPINHIWNWFYKNTTNPYLAVLNNDIEICDNFLSNAEKIFTIEPICGLISHPTNIKKYTKNENLNYDIIQDKIFLQGWDFIIKREAYKEIPNDLWIYGGDNYLFSEIIKNGYKQIYDLSSPIIHYRSKTINANKNKIQKYLEKDHQIYNKKYTDFTIFSNHKYCNIEFKELFPIDLTKKVIVSFTTWEKRISNIPYIFSLLMKQTKIPDKIILNISKEEFNNKKELLKDVLRLEKQNSIFFINWVEGENTKVWKKFIPIVEKYPNDLIITIDDDIEYPKDFIEILYNSYLKNPYSPITGIDKIWYGLHHCCGAYNLFEYKYLKLYLNLWKDVYKDIYSSDTFYIYILKLNGYDFKTSNKVFYNNLRSYNSCNSYSMMNFKKNKNWTLNTYYYLINKYGMIDGFNPIAFGDNNDNLTKRKDSQIFVLCYKNVNYKIPNNNLYTPIQCGADIFSYDIDNCKIKDNTCNNISIYNSFYAEVTGTYWVWKNVSKYYKYIGQCQYRRQLILNENINLDNIFSNYEVITSKILILETTVYKQFGLCHNINDLIIVQNIINKNFPEYSSDFVKYIINDDKLYGNSGIILKSEDFNKYCNFLFTIIDEHKKLNNINDIYDMKVYLTCDNKRKNIERQRFLYGFLAERIMTLFIRHNFNRILEIPYYEPEKI